MSLGTSRKEHFPRILRPCDLRLRGLDTLLVDAWVEEHISRSLVVDPNTYVEEKSLEHGNYIQTHDRRIGNMTGHVAQK